MRSRELSKAVESNVRFEALEFRRMLSVSSITNASSSSALLTPVVSPVFVLDKTASVATSTATVASPLTLTPVTDAAVSLAIESSGTITFTPIDQPETEAIPTVTLNVSQPTVSTVAANEAGDLMSYLDQTSTAADPATTATTAVAADKSQKAQPSAAAPMQQKAPAAAPTAQPAAQPAADHSQAIPAPVRTPVGPGAMLPQNKVSAQQIATATNLSLTDLTASAAKPVAVRSEKAATRRIATAGAVMLVAASPMQRSRSTRRKNAMKR